MPVRTVAVIGVRLVVRELQFGRECARLATQLEQQGALPAEDLPRR